jgi:uncharacterized protein YbjT (DUF2867 family)
MNRIWLLTCPILFLGMAACDRPMVEPTEEAAAALVSERQRVILVTGATGTQGGAVARELLERGYAVRALTRDPNSEGAQALATLGAKPVKGDFENAASLVAAMEGVDGVFGVTLFWNGGYQAEVEQGKRLIDAAVKAGIGQFVLTSVAGADQQTGIPHFDSKWEVEQYLHATDLDWTIIRPVEFMDNWAWDLEQFRSGVMSDPRDSQSSHQWIAARYIGFFVAEAFDHPDDWTGVTQEIAGEELTLDELRVILSEVFGMKIEHVQPTWEAFEAEVGEEISVMVRWFDDDGYAVDVNALRARYPNLTSARDFLAEMAGTPPE